ncbi:hypothetical protein NPIL_277641 [Nephila pilipes]|uniref:Uncharacterized protein n=1 Tax=Nephila pilipes TaxID=299642 RepID=A0A8X6Q275_NEPPI|nr:hypothetical protein NPIL_277641 [Nephila pilipes]
MEQSNSRINYPESFSNEIISQNVQQSNISLNCQESISNESFTHFTQHQNSVYNPITTSDKRIIDGMEPSNSYLNYPGEIYSENNWSSMQETSLFLHANSLKPSESISRDMQLSSIPQNYTGSISNDLVTHFQQRQNSVHNPVHNLSESISYGTEQSSSYLNYPRLMSRENNSSAMQHSNLYVNYTGSMSVENNSSSMQHSSLYVNYPVSTSCEINSNSKQHSCSYLNYSRSMSRENNSSYLQHSSLFVNYSISMSRENNSGSMQHSSSSLHAPVSNSNESESRNMYMEIQEPSYNFGNVQAKKNISCHIKNSNSSFANLESTLRGCISHDMEDLSYSFNYYKASSNDFISSENL